MTRALALLMLGALLAATPCVAAAQSRTTEEVAREGLADARRRYSDLDYQGAVEVLTRVLGLTGARDADRLEAFEYLGACYVILEREPDAREAFSQMLALDPYHALREPTGSPKIARLVAELRAQVAPDAALDPDVRLTLDLPRAARVHATARATVRVVDTAGKVARVTVFVRGAADEAFEPIDATHTGATFVATLPARDAPDELEVYAEARDAQDHVVARAGEPLTPASLPVHGDPGGGGGGGEITGQWWFWAIIAGVVAITTGVVVGLVVGTRDTAPEGSLPPGRVMLPLVSF